MTILQVTTDLLTDYLFKAEVIDSGIDNVIAAVTVAATILAAIFYFSNLGFNYAVTTLKNLKDKNAEFFVDYEELARTLVLVGCILIYPAIANTLNFGMDSINKLTHSSHAQMKEYENLLIDSQKEVVQQTTIEEIDKKVLEKAMTDNTLPPELKKYTGEKLNEIKEEEGKDSVQPQDKNEQGIWETIAYYLNPANAIMGGISALVGLLTSIIRIIIAALTVNVLKVLFCIGPLAFAFSILPPFKNNVTLWFGTVLNTGFVFTTMNILDAVFYETLFVSKNAISHGDVSVSANLAMNITYIILYLMVFWLTSKYVGKGDAGRVLSKAAGIATAAVGGAMMASSGASASNVANVAGSANDIIQGK